MLAYRNTPCILTSRNYLTMRDHAAGVCGYGEGIGEGRDRL